MIDPDMEDLEQIRRDFSQLAALPDDQVDLFKGMLTLSRIEYPYLDESYYQTCIQIMADRLKERLVGVNEPQGQIQELNQIFVEEEGFSGNTGNYYDPENSFLNRVIDRKIGIPISLSVVYMEIACRAGLTVLGVGLPGHFMTVLIHPPHRYYLDPFTKGAILTEWECRQKVMISLGMQKANDPHLLDPVTSKEILVRTLRNLKAIYVHMDQGIKAFQMIHWILELNKNALPELKDRAYIYEHIGDTERAVKDLKHYLHVNKDAEDAEEIRQKIKTLSALTSKLH